jgi:hypothetical protein
MLRASPVHPLSFAFLAALKPGAYIELCNPCVAQAQGDLPWTPVERMRRPLEASGKTFRAFAVPLRAESRRFAVHGKPRSSHAMSPVSHALENK